MYRFLSNFLKPHHFSNSGGSHHHYIEIDASAQSTSESFKTRCLRGKLNECEIESWLQQESLTVAHSDGAAWKLRILFSPARRDPELSNEPYYFRQSTYDSIVRAFRIPPAFLTLVTSFTTIHTSFELEDGSYGILANISSHGLALRFDPGRRETVCYIVGLCEHQIERCQEELHRCTKHGSCPMLFPAIWLDVFIETRVLRAAARTDTICHIQKKTGLHWSVNNMADMARKIDFEEITYALTVLGSELAWDEFAISILKKIQEKVLASHKHFVRQVKSTTINETDRPLFAHVDFVSTRLMDSRAILCGLRGKTRYNTEQVKMQNQAIYNLISQRDNRLAIKTAEHIRRIAQSTQADNTVMRSIAEDSRKLAESSRRDGAEMRVIAIVTLLFLPATFVATFFSTSFFDFGSQLPSKNGPTVSSWVWVYCVIAISLTVIVIGVWYLIVHRNRNGIHQHRQASEAHLENPHPLQDESFEFRQDFEAFDDRSSGNSSSTWPCVIGKKGNETTKLELPASKVVFKGSGDVTRTCACCARLIEMIE